MWPAGEQQGLLGLGPRRGARVQQNDSATGDGESPDGASSCVGPRAVVGDRAPVGVGLILLMEGCAVRGVGDREGPAAARGVDPLFQEAAAVVVVDALEVPVQ